MTDKTDSKDREVLREAERLLRRDAESLRESHTSHANREDWTGEEDAKAGYDEYISAADALAALAGRASLAASAGSEPVAPEDYVPMLDDEGRMMVGASHHYTAENIRALVAEYKALEAGAPEAMERYSNSDHRTRAGVLWRVISALADEVPFTHPSPPEGAGWISVKDQLPPCRDDQDYIGINSAGFAGVFNAVRVIDGNTYCLMETAEESVSIMSDLAIWKPFTRPDIPAPPASEAKGA